MHRAPVGIKGVILVEHVILAFVIGKAVRVIHPACAGGQVEGRPFLFGNELLLLLLIFSAISQNLGYHSVLLLVNKVYVC